MAQMCLDNLYKGPSLFPTQLGSPFYCKSSVTMDSEKIEGRDEEKGKVAKGLCPHRNCHAL